MITIKREGIILEPTELEFENKGVFNPACIREGRYVHMFYRAWDKHNRSTIGYCKLDGPLTVVERAEKPILFSEFEYEKCIEDPRIVLLDGTYYLTYVAYDGKNTRLAYATSKDLKNFEKKGLILPDITYDEAEDILRTCPAIKERYFLFESYFKDIVAKDVLLWNKNTFLFPKKINGKFALIHRILPDIQVIYFDDFKDLTPDFWRDYLKILPSFVVLESRHWYEVRNVGGGCPPIETNKGWILIYHGVDDLNVGRIYRAGVALLDKSDPTKVISHPREPLFSPETEWEKKGNVNNVVFPSGAVIFGKRLYIYYGAADMRIGVISLDINELLDELTRKQ